MESDNIALIRRLHADLLDANLRVGEMATRHGVNSPELAEAMAAADAIRNRIREIARSPGSDAI